jgi:hypothetical protein
MRDLLDTGILARLPHRADPLNEIVRDALRRLALDRHTLVTSTQNIAEFPRLVT